MVLKLDGNSGFSTHAWSKKGLFIEKKHIVKIRNNPKFKSSGNTNDFVYACN